MEQIPSFVGCTSYPLGKGVISIPKTAICKLVLANPWYLGVSCRARMKLPSRLGEGVP